MNYEDIGDDPQEAPEPFEKGVAMQLGMIVLAHSRLDMTLQRYLQEAAAGAAGATAPTFSGKLESLRALAGAMDDGPRKRAIDAWVAQCDVVPLLRDERVRAHWLPDARSGRLVNLPGGDADSEAMQSFAAKDLAAVLAALGELQAALGRLH